MRRPQTIRSLTVAVFILTVLGRPGPTAANEDVYRTLPEDVEVVEFMVGDIDGNGVTDLGVLYTRSRVPRLTFFRAPAGRWDRWFDVDGTFLHREGMTVRSFGLEDITGDGRAEMLLFHLDAVNGSLHTTILSYAADGPDPGFAPLLEDSTTPPGYPLVGRHRDQPSVTFLNMGEGDGYRRVWCWQRQRFEKCEEVIWEKP